MTRIALLLLVGAGCSNAVTGGDGGDLAMGPPDLAPEPATVGADGRATFGYAFCFFGGCAIDRHWLLAGGAHAGIHVTVHDGTAVASVASSDPSVAGFALDRGDGGEVRVTTAGAGHADLILRDGMMGEIDRVTVTVAAADRIEAVAGWRPAAGPTILAGSLQTLLLIPRSGTERLWGSGGVRYAVDGAIRFATIGRVPDSLVTGDQAGAGHLTATCMQASIAVPITVVDASGLTAVDVAPARLVIPHGDHLVGLVTVTARAGQTPVFVNPCIWNSSPAGGMILSQTSGTPDTGPAITYSVGGAPGHYTMTCPVGNLTATLDAQIN